MIGMIPLQVKELQTTGLKEKTRKEKKGTHTQRQIDRGERERKREGEKEREVSAIKAG